MKVTAASAILRNILRLGRARDAEWRPAVDYEALVNSVDGILWEADAQTFRFTFVSKQAERLLGYPLERWLTEPTFWADHVHPEDREWTAASCLKATEEMRPHELQYRMMAADGRIVWLSDIVTVSVEGGRPARLRGVMVDVTEQKRMEDELCRRDAILDTVTSAAQQLLVTTSADWSTQEVLRRLGEATGVSRVYIFENGAGADGARLCSQRFEWVAPGVSPQIGNPELQDFPWDEGGFGRWAEAMAQGEAVYGAVREFPESEKQVLCPQGILSLVATPIFVGQEWWGFVGVDDCATGRPWSVAEVSALKAAAGIIGAAIQRRRGEEEVRASEETARALLNAPTEAAVMTDTEGRILAANQAAAERLGTSVDELVGADAYSLMSADLAESRRRKLNEVVRSRRPLRFEEQRDGRWLDTSLYPILDGEGKVIRLAAFSQDVTERRQAEAALRQSEERYRELVENLNEVVFSVSAEGLIAYISPAIEQVSGYTPAEVTGRSFAEFIHPEDVKPLLLSFGKAISGVMEPSEYRVVTKGGDVRWVHSFSRPIREEDRIAGVQGTLVDITQRKQAEEALQGLREDLDSKVEREMQRGNSYGLTFRELTVLHLVAGGKADKEIATALGISPQTVHKHLTSILAKMGAASRTQAGVRGIREGLIA